MSTEDAPSLRDLPDDVILVILNQVGDVKSLGACAASCRRLRACVPRVSTAVVSVDNLLKAGAAADTTGPASASSSSSSSSSSASSSAGKGKAMTQLKSAMASLLRSFQQQQQREDDEGSSSGSDHSSQLAQSGRDGRGGRGSVVQVQQQRQQQCFDVEDVVRRFPMLQELLIVLPDCEFSLDREASLHWYADFNETLSSCAIVAADSISLLSHPTPIPHLSSPTSSTPTPSASPPPSTPPASHSPPPSTPPAPPSPAPPPPPPLSCPHQDTSMSNRRPSRVPSLSRSSSSQTPLWAPLWDWMSAAGTSSSPRQGTTTASSTSHQQATATHTSPSTSPDSTSPSHPPQHCNGTSPLSPCHENAQGDAVSAGRRMGNRQQRGADRGKGRDKGKGKEKVELRSDSSVDSGDRGNAGQLEQQQGGCIVARLGFSRVVDITDSSQQPNRNERPAVGMPPPVPPRSLASMTRLLAASRGRAAALVHGASRSDKGRGSGSGGGSGSGSSSGSGGGINGNGPSHTQMCIGSSAASGTDTAAPAQSSGSTAAGSEERSSTNDSSDLSTSNSEFNNPGASASGDTVSGGRGNGGTTCMDSRYSDHNRPTDLVEALRRSTANASDRGAGSSSGSSNTNTAGHCVHQSAFADDCSKGNGGADNQSGSLSSGRSACDTSRRSNSSESGGRSSNSGSSSFTNHRPPFLTQVHAASSTAPSPGPSRRPSPYPHSTPSLPSASIRYPAPTSPTSSCFPTSSTRRQPFRPPPIRLTPNGLKERIAWTISAAVAASARHELLRRIARQLPELRQVAIADMQGQGSLSLGPEQLACLRRAEAENVSGEHSNAYSPRTPLPTLKMLLWHAPSLSVGDMELTGATLVILRNEALKVAKAGGELEGSLDSGTADSLHSSSQDQMGGLECRGEIAERRDAEQCLQSLLASSDPLLHASLELLQLSQTQRFEFSAF